MSRPFKVVYGFRLERLGETGGTTTERNRNRPLVIFSSGIPADQSEQSSVITG